MHKALFLLAGIGSRLRPLTGTTPKPLLNVAGRPLISRSIDALVACGITDVAVVTGHLDDQVRDFFGSSYPGLTVEFVHNERYAETNNAYSLLLARDAFSGKGMLLLDGDLLYDPRILRPMLTTSGSASSCLAIRPSKTLGDEEVKVIVNGIGGIVAIGKHLSPSECIGESLGIARFDASATEHLFATLDHRMNVLGMTGEFYEASFQQMIDRGIRIGMVETGDAICMEIDTVEDLEMAEKIADRIDRRTIEQVSAS